MSLQVDWWKTDCCFVSFDKFLILIYFLVFAHTISEMDCYHFPGLLLLERNRVLLKALSDVCEYLIMGWYNGLIDSGMSKLISWYSVKERILPYALK